MNIVKLNKLNTYAKLAVSAFAVVSLASVLVMPAAYADEMAKGCEHHHAFFERHQKELHDKLVLTANQEPAWKIFVENTKPLKHEDGMHQSAEWAKLKTPERLDLMLAKTKEHEQRLEVHAQATKEFYKQLTPAQQAIFDETFQHHSPHER